MPRIRARADFRDGMNWTFNVSPALFPAGLTWQISLLSLQLLRPSCGNSLWTIPAMSPVQGPSASGSASYGCTGCPGGRSVTFSPDLAFPLAREAPFGPHWSFPLNLSSSCCLWHSAWSESLRCVSRGPLRSGHW